MPQIVPGSIVVHDKLPELGRAEVLSAEKDTLKLRFASGERSFATAVVSPHLSVVEAGPPARAPVKAAKRTRKASASTGSTLKS
jgi:hypothetical protein